MHVECSACHARYTIADDKIPIQGARVRCRKCQAVFSIDRSAPALPPTPSELPLIPPTPQAPAPAAPAAPPESGIFGGSSMEGSSPFGDAPGSMADPSPFAAPPRPMEPRTSFAPPSAPFGPPEGEPRGSGGQVPPTEIERFANAFASSAPPASPPAPAAPAPFSGSSASLATPSRAPMAEPASPASPSPAPAPPIGASPSSSGIPEGLPEAERLKHERARRLARVLASDIAIYNKEKRERGVKDGNLVAVLGYEIKKSWEVYKERVTPEMANATPYFRDALNEMLAEGRKVF